MGPRKCSRMTMPVLKWRGKQEFNESDVVRWKEALKRALPLLGILLKYEVGVPIIVLADSC